MSAFSESKGPWFVPRTGLLHELMMDKKEDLYAMFQKKKKNDYSNNSPGFSSSRMLHARHRHEENGIHFVFRRSTSALRLLCNCCRVATLAELVSVLMRMSGMIRSLCRHLADGCVLEVWQGEAHGVVDALSRTAQRTARHLVAPRRHCGVALHLRTRPVLWRLVWWKVRLVQLHLRRPYVEIL